MGKECDRRGSIRESTARRLHAAVLSHDRDAVNELASLVILTLRPRLRRLFPHAPLELTVDAIDDAILEYAEHPERLPATPDTSVINVFQFRAARNLSNLLRAEIVRKLYERQYAIGNQRHTAIVEPQLRNMLNEEAKRHILTAATGSGEREALNLWLNGETSTAALALALGISKLSMSEQRVEIKRFKDRMLKRVVRLKDGSVLAALSTRPRGSR